MKFFSAVFILVVIIALGQSVDPAEKKRMLLKVVQSCQSETNASEDDMAKIAMHSPNMSHEGKCMFSCIMTKMELVIYYV
jgi:PBP/GOBP family